MNQTDSTAEKQSVIPEAVKQVSALAGKKKAKKLFAWAVTKSAAIKTILAAIPEPVVSKVLLAFQTVGNLVKGVFQKIKENPEKAVAIGGALMAAPLLLPLPPLIGLISSTAGFITGAAGLIGGAAKWLGALSSGIGNLISAGAGLLNGFLTALSSVALPTGLAAFSVGIAVAITASVNFLTQGIAPSAFLQEGLGELKQGLGISVTARPYDEAGHLAEKVIYTLQECGLNYVKKSNWKRVVNCLESSSLPNTPLIIEEFRYSVFYVRGGLECVAFVRGVMAALGRDLGQRYRGANDYLNRPEDDLYYIANGDAGQAQPGDLMIIKGSTYGHIAIMVEWREDKILIAQAFGPSGLISMEEINPYYFTGGFLRPK